MWQVVSEDAVDFIQKLIVRNPAERMTAEQALAHKWIVELGPKDSQPLPSTVMRRLKRFASENKFKQAAKRVMLIKKFMEIVGSGGKTQCTADVDCPSSYCMLKDNAPFFCHDCKYL